jgi:acetoin utilization deacetylase AcuC-like enzyme
MKAYFSDHYVLPLPEGHRFPMRKYWLLRERVAAELTEIDLCEPLSATDGQLALVHDPDYVWRVASNQLQPSEIREIGFPWSEAMVERSRRSAGATIAACRAAFETGVSASLAGGTHHASIARGSGFCVFNDTAVAARLMQTEQHRLAPRPLIVAIVDLDVHQGNGTAEIFANDETVYTFSIHGEGNFPFRKAKSDLDVGLPDGTGDAPYLNALSKALEYGVASVSPGLIIYLAGADVHEGDRLGRLNLTKEGIASRDAMVLNWAAERKIPVAVVMAGGYGRDIHDTVDVHLNTVRTALGVWRGRAESRALLKSDNRSDHP